MEVLLAKYPGGRGLAAPDGCSGSHLATPAAMDDKAAQDWAFTP